MDGNPLADIKVLQDVEKIKLVMLEGKVEVDTGLKFINNMRLKSP